MTPDIVLLIVAFFCFLLAASPFDTRGWKFEWLGFAALVVTLIL